MIAAKRRRPFAPMKTTSLTFAFTTYQAPLQVSDVVIPGVPAIRAPRGSLRLACGRGPRLTVDGKSVPTKVTDTYADLLAGASAAVHRLPRPHARRRHQPGDRARDRRL